MSDVELFLVLIALIFVYESVITFPVGLDVVRRGALGWRLVSPLVLRGGAGPAVVLAMLVPPLGLVLAGRRGGRLARDEARARVATLVSATRPLRVMASALWVAIGGGAAWLAFGPASHEALVLSTLAGLWAATVGVGLFVRRRLPVGSRPPWRETVVAMLSPISVLRLHDLYTKRGLEDLDALAIAAAVMRADRVKPALREALARARFGGAAGPQTGRDEAELSALARELGFDPAALLAAPEREGAHAAAYCPVCQAQFMGGPAVDGRSSGGPADAATECESCGGVRLIRFGSV